VIVVLGEALMSTSLGQSEASTAVPASYSRTLTGADFRSLDVRIGLQFIPNSGGNVYPRFLDDGSHTIPAPNLEASLNLPIGANITSIRFYYRDCGYHPGDGQVYPNGNFYAGYYTPSTSTFAYVVNQTHGTLACGLRNFVKTGSPLAVVGANRQYVVGAYMIGEVDIVASNDPPFVLAGAKVIWTCPTGCH
jgi:hypothetical protein